MPSVEEHRRWMQQALEIARGALPDDVPVGALLLHQGKVIAEACNDRERHHSPLGHAELNVLKVASEKLGRWRLNDTMLYVTLEPCPMCASAIQQARVGQVIFGASDPLMGACGSHLSILKEGQPAGQDTKVIGGILGEECRRLLKDFFQSKR